MNELVSQNVFEWFLTLTVGVVAGALRFHGVL